MRCIATASTTATGGSVSSAVVSSTTPMGGSVTSIGGAATTPMGGSVASVSVAADSSPVSIDMVDCFLLQRITAGDQCRYKSSVKCTCIPCTASTW